MNCAPLPTVPCRWCGEPTTYCGTRECDPCHNVASRAYRDPALARRIANGLEHGTRPGYYECHVTFTTPTGLDPGIRGWKFSRIDGDPVLGRGVKSYLTRQFKDSRPLREVIDEVEFTAAMLRDSGPEFVVLRTKVEHVCYDSKQLPDSLLQ